MHVLLTVNAAWNVRNFRWPILRALVGRGDRVTVLAPPDRTVPEIEAAGARFVPLRMDSGAMGPADNLRLLRQLHAVFKRERPDVILSWTIKNNIFGALSSRTLGIPFVPNVSGLGTAFLSGNAMALLARSLYRLAFAKVGTVFFQNEEDLALFVAQGMVPHRAAALLPGSGIDLERFSPASFPPGDPVFLMIARLLGDKGVREFVEAARLVRAERPDVRFRLVGDAASANRTAIAPATIAGWKDEGVVELPGPVDDVRPEIADSHCVILPSYREGAPRTLIEAAAMARPLIATDVPGCRAVVDPAVTGLLCAPRSALALAEACRAMLAMDAGACAEMGKAGRRKMEAEYDERLVVAAYLEAIDRASRARALPSLDKPAAGH